MPNPVVGCEDPMWYDGIYCYMDRNWKKYSTRANLPIANDEMCKYWYIYKVKQVKDWDWPFNYHYEILSKREDA